MPPSLRDAKSQPQRLPPDGGRRFGGGGFFIPSRKYSPVSTRFQFTEMFWPAGWDMLSAPWLHSSMHTPQNQHSSGYSTIGGLCFSGLGIITSVGQTSRQRLQPL